MLIIWNINNVENHKMDLNQELEILKKKEELLSDMIKKFELQQHKLQSEMKTLELIIG